MGKKVKATEIEKLVMNLYYAVNEPIVISLLVSKEGVEFVSSVKKELYLRSAEETPEPEEIADYKKELNATLKNNKLDYFG